MIINNIKLKNFGCISSFDRRFGKGIFILSGENGNGKSTVFKAIVLALFDSYEGSLVDYVNWNADEFEINIDFEHLGRQYNVTVKYNVRSKTAERQIIDKSAPDNVRVGQEAKDYLKKIFDQELIKAAMLSLEQQIDVVTVKPADRREYLKRIYDLEFKNQQQNIADSLAALGKKTTALNTQLNILRSKKYEDAPVPELPMTEKEYDALQAAYSANMEQIGKLKAEQEQYETAIKTVGDLTVQADKTRKEIDQCGKQVEEKKKSLESLPLESKKRTVLLEIEIDSGEKEIKLIEANKTTCLAAKDAQIAEIKIVRVPEFDQDSFNKAKTELGVVKGKIKELSVSDVCPTCGQKLPQDEAAVAERKKELDKYAVRENELYASILVLEKEAERINQLSKTNQENKDRKTKLIHERELMAQNYESDLRETRASVESLKSALSGETENLKKLTEAGKSEIAILESLLEEKRNSLAKTEDLLNKAKAVTVENPAGKLEKVQALAKENKSKIDNYQDVRTERETAIKQNEQTAKQKKTDETEIKRLDTELQEVSREVAELESCVKILKNEFPVFVISKIVKDLETSMNDFLRKTYSGRYTVKLEDKKNALRMVYGPKGMDAGMASGYEKSIFSLAWKWALSRVQNNRTLMMDEVDSAASQKNSMLFYQTVGDSLKLFDQILIVSHKEQTRELLENEFGAQVLTFTGGVAA